MPSLFADHNVSRPVVERLRAFGYDVIASREIAFERANDDETLLHAARGDRILLTPDVQDLELLHDAWRRWSSEWGVERRHAGILIVPQEWSSDRKVQEITAFLSANPDLSFRRYRWRSPGGWDVRPLLSVLS